jgi:hypothetical protein
VTTAVLPEQKNSDKLDKRERLDRSAVKSQELPPIPLAPIPSTDYEEARRRMEEQIQLLSRRFDDLEMKRERNTQREIILFVGTGAFILACMDIVTRLARR